MNKIFVYKHFDRSESKSASRMREADFMCMCIHIHIHTLFFTNKTALFCAKQRTGKVFWVFLNKVFFCKGSVNETVVNWNHSKGNNPLKSPAFSVLINACGHKLRRTKNFSFLKKDRFFGETAFVMLQTETGGGGFLCICVCTYKYFFGKFGFETPKRAIFYRKCSRFVFFMM